MRVFATGMITLDKMPARAPSTAIVLLRPIKPFLAAA